MRQALVTGASKGMGRAMALQLAKDGFLTVVHYLKDEEGARHTLAEIEQVGGTGRLLCFDISDAAQCRAVLEADMEEHGAYYGIVSNAGITRDNVFPAMTVEEWNTVIHTNLDSFYNVLQPCIMPMINLRTGGRIVTIASLSGIMGNYGQTNYSAAKAGLIAATKSLAVELGRRKITVNCVAPGLIETDMVNDMIKEHALPLIPLKRMGRPEEVAGLVSYLMSDVAAYVTRQVVSINGGMA